MSVWYECIVFIRDTWNWSVSQVGQVSRMNTFITGSSIIYGGTGVTYECMSVWYECIVFICDTWNWIVSQVGQVSLVNTFITGSGVTWIQSYVTCLGRIVSQVEQVSRMNAWVSGMNVFICDTWNWIVSQVGQVSLMNTFISGSGVTYECMSVWYECIVFICDTWNWSVSQVGQVWRMNTFIGGSTAMYEYIHTSRVWYEVWVKWDKCHVWMYKSSVACEWIRYVPHMNVWRMSHEASGSSATY